MSFKATSSAAELFLGVFYHSLFINGAPISEASRRGREAMHQYPSRQARLRLRRDLIDYFVPVMYCNGGDALFASPTTVKATKAFPLVIDPAAWSRENCSSSTGLQELDEDVISWKFRIFVGKSPDVSDIAIEPDLLAELRQAHFKLRPLRLAEALELSQNDIRRAGVETAEWKEGDSNELSLLMGLLDGNPAAILHVVPQIPQTKASLKELRAVIQLDMPLGATPTKGLLNEISSLFRQLPEGQGAAVMLLSMFWIEAPPNIAFSDWITSTNIFDEQTFWMATRKLLNQGLIETDADSNNPQGTGKGPQRRFIHVGFEEVHYDLGWWPENFDLYQFSRRLGNPDARLAELEEVMVSGNNARVCWHLMAMLWEAAGKLEFEEVEEYGECPREDV
ncbi:hypothetical protein DL767_003926 [Monosporascus sp. MG133]|nr:hypothetical protein DL767_003926 [Monosporascus sp. MG133]